MSDNTPIEWTDATWPIVAGCEKKTRGCKNCWAIRDSWRLAHNPHEKVRDAYVGTVHKVGSQLAWTGTVRPLPDRLGWPLKWSKPKKIFVCSQSDLFHPAVPDAFIAEAFGVMAVCGARERGEDMSSGCFGATWTGQKWRNWKGPHTFQVLTKEPQRMARLLTSPRFREEIARAAYRWAHNQRDAGYLAHQIGAREEYARCYDPGRMWPLVNVWLGTSVENQECADLRREPMRALAAAGWLTWVSNEPAVGPVDWLGWEFIRWMVSGGESGSKAAPMHPDWMRASRDFCERHGIAWLLKQWGAWSTTGPIKARTCAIDLQGRTAEAVLRQNFPKDATSADGWQTMYFVGKKAAGRLLDGREHNEFPETTR